VKNSNKSVARLIELVDNSLDSRKEKPLPSGVGRILEGLSGIGTTIPQPLPIQARSSDWEIETSPERIVKSFEFDTYKGLNFFIFHLLEYQEEKQHHALISINHRVVKVEAYTHDINSVTHLDKALAKFCDELYEDVTHIGERA